MKTSRVCCALLVSALATLALSTPAYCFPGSGKTPKNESAAERGPQIPPEAPIAVVNGQPVTKQDYDRALSAHMRMFRQSQGGAHGGVNEPNQQMKQAVLQRLVGEELLYQESRKFPVADAAKQVDDVYQRNRARAPSAEAFEQALAAEGLTEQSLKDMIARRLSLWNYVQTQIRPGAEVNDQEVAQYYEQNPDRFTIKEEMVRASHILTQARAGAKQEAKDSARKRAGELQERAAAGEDFADLARKNSQGPSAANGGDLGFFTRQRMVKPFADAAFALEVGAVSEVVETEYGYHVIKLTDRREPGLQSLDQVREEIVTQLTEMAVNKAVQTKIDELRSNADIQLLTPHL